MLKINKYINILKYIKNISKYIKNISKYIKTYQKYIKIYQNTLPSLKVDQIEPFFCDLLLREPLFLRSTFKEIYFQGGFLCYISIYNNIMIK